MPDDGPPLPPLEQLNQLSPTAFAAALKPLFETAEPLGTALAIRRPFSSYGMLIDTAEAIAAGCSEAERIAILNAHPRIGEYAARVSALSYVEQSYDTETTQDADELAEVYRQLAQLNDAYEHQFGFRFVVFVNKRPKAVILKVLRERIGNPRQQELATGLAAIFSIATDRLASMTQPAPDSIDGVQLESDIGFLAVLEELRRAALTAFGEERIAEAPFEFALGVAAKAVWRVTQEPLEPQGDEPLPTHG
jgi:2-oxo-4-hydroxy-4-carboxy--5-ureidoimidazoline (OHCU) decarboxylase